MALVVLGTESYCIGRAHSKREEGGSNASFPFCRGRHSLLQQMGKESDCMKGNSFFYVWKKSRFHLAGGHVKEEGKVLLHY